MWVSLEDVHASSAAALLDALAEAGIPAYVQASEPLGSYDVGGHRTRHQLLRVRSS